MKLRLKHIISRIVILLLIIAVVLAWVFFQPKTAETPLMDVSIGSIQSKTDEYGLIDSTSKITLRAKVKGTLTLTAMEGDIVSKNAILATLNNPKLKDTLIQKQNTVSLAKLDYETALRKYEQGQKLKTLNTLSEDALLTLSWAVTRSKIGLYNAQKGLEAAQKDYNGRIITAPFSGKILYISAIQGNEISEGNEILTLADMNNLFVQMSLPQSYLPHIKIGQKVVFSGSSGRGRRQARSRTKVSQSTISNEDKILQISQKIDPQPTNTNPSFTVKISYKPSDLSSVFVGGLVQGSIILAEKTNIPTLPLTALHGNSKTGYYVLRQNGQKVTKEPVKIGISDSQSVEIVSNTQNLKNIIFTSNP